jgi:HK97 family phage major capsid protein
MNSTPTPEQRTKINAAFKSLLRYGIAANSREQRDIISTNSEGQAVIPLGFDSAILESQKFYGKLPSLAHRRPVDGGSPQKIAQTDFTSAGMSLVQEGTTSFLTSTDPTVSSQAPETDSIAALVKVSWAELNSGFDLLEWLRNQAGPIVARATEHVLTVGRTNDGLNTVLPNTTPFLPSIPASVTGSTIAATLSTTNVVANLSATVASLDHGYFEAPGAGWMCSPSVFNALLAMQDSTGRPLWPVGDDGVMRIFGKSVYPNAAFPALGTPSSVQLAFGDYSRAFGYVDGSVTIKPLVERFATTLETGVLVYRRLAGVPLITSSVAGLYTPAS